MAKDNRVIREAVRVRVNDESRTFPAGQEDELAAVLTPEQGASLIEREILEGDWTFTGGAVETAPQASEPKPDPVVASLTAERDNAVKERDEANRQCDIAKKEAADNAIKAQDAVKERDDLKKQLADAQGEIATLKKAAPAK